MATSSKWKPADLISAIKTASQKAHDKCESLKSKEVVCLIGSTGCGKTTVANYALKNSFTFNRNCTALQPERVLEGFEMGDQFSSLTRGMESAVLANHLCLVDLAGTGDTEGELREVEGAIFRSSVLQSASSVRIALVFSISKLKVERGKFFVQDLEHIAQMGKGLRDFPVGMILTAEPELLRQRDAADLMLEKMHDAMPRLIEAVEQETMETKVPEVKALLSYFEKHFKKAVEGGWWLECEEGDYFAVHPINVTNPKMQQAFLKFLKNLPKIESPTDVLTCPLPQACQTELSATLGKMFLESTTACRDMGPAFAGEPQLVQRVVDLLHLSGILLDLKLLPSVSDKQEDLEEAVVSQNRKAVESLCVGLAVGPSAEVGVALRALTTMERLRAELEEQGVLPSLEGWVGLSDAVSKGCSEAERVINMLLPDGFAGDIKWNTGLSRQFCGVLEGVEQLGESGSKLLAQWAGDLVERRRRLECQVTQDSRATGVLHALMQLKSEEEHLPRVAEILGRHCEALQEFPGAFERAKAALLRELGELSQKMEGSPLGRLEDLCRSTELNAELGEDLVYRFITKPLAVSLAVKQDDVDCICNKLEDSAVDSGVWSAELQDLATRVEALTKLGPEVMKAGGTLYGKLLDATQARTAWARNRLTMLTSRLKAASEKAEGSCADSACGDDNERTAQLQADDALQTLVALLPADPLLRFFSYPLHSTADAALQLVIGSMRSVLKASLRGAQDIKKTKCYAGAALDGDVIDALNNLKVCMSLAEVFLRSAPEGFQADALTSIRDHILGSEKLIESVLEKELGEWSQAEAGDRNWTQLFAHNLNTARRLKSLAPQKIGPRIQDLQKAVTNWQSKCLQAAEGALNAGNWRDFIEQAIRKGMDFELSDLFNLMRTQQQLHPQFQSMVEEQADAWKQAAAESQYSGSKRQHWEKLNALCTALASLRGFRKASGLVQLHGSLKEALRPLESTLLSNNEKLLQACDTRNFAEAVALLRSVSDPMAQREVVMEHLGRYTDAVCEELELECEEGGVTAIKTVGKVMKDIEAFHDDEVKTQALVHRERLKKALDSKKEDASRHLQRALHGYGSLGRALALGAALNRKSKETLAEEVLSAFLDLETKAFQEFSLSELAQWAARHSSVRNSMPAEFKACKEALENLTVAFVKSFKKTSDKEREELEDCVRRKMWGEAKLKREMIQEAVADIDGLEMLERKAKVFKSVKRSVGLVAGDDQPMYEDLRRGDFWRAVQALVVSGTGERADTICRAIHTALDAHMNVRALDGTVNFDHLCVLENFLREVGDHPPDELRELHTRVKLSCAEVSAQVSQHVDESLHQMLDAVAQQDLASMAKAMVSVERAKFRMREKQRSQLEQTVGSYWKGVSLSVDKAGRDIESLDANAVSLSLRPLDTWLQAFAALRSGEKEVMMASCPKNDNATADLGAWVRSKLAKCTRELVDANAIMKKTQEQNFGEISKRYQVAEHLRAVINSRPLDLEPVKEYLRQRREEASKAVDQRDLRGFNNHLKLLKMADQQLPEAGLGDCVVELEQGLRIKILEPRKEEVAQKRDLPGVVSELVAMRTLAEEVPEAYAMVIETMTQSFKALQSNPLFSKSMNALGIHLSATTVGQQIIGEQETTFSIIKSKSLTALFRKGGQTEPGEVVARLAAQSGLQCDEALQLKKVLGEHEKRLWDLQFKYLAQGKGIDDVLREAKLDLDTKVAEATSTEGGRALLTQLVATYMIVRSGKAYLEATPEEQDGLLVVPHSCQLLVLFRLLRLHKPGNSGWWSWFGKRSELTQNHLAQVLTGEGKCLTLGLLAAFLALKGTGSDIVCYRKFLSDQDRSAMQPFLEFVGVDGQVRYATFDELCSERLDVIAKATTELLESSHVTKNKDLDKSQRALLIDEVDVLFGRSFYGQTWDGAFKLRCVEAQALVRFIFSEEQAGRDATCTVLESQEFKALTKRFPPEMEPVFNRVALALARNVKEWSSPTPELSKDGTRVGYKERDEISFDMSYANKTVFAYLTFEMNKRITAAVADQHIGIDLVCGRFSYAELPKSYRFILGVTGTLRELLEVDGIRKVIETDYKIENFTYAPSVFGERRLNFKEGEHVDFQLTESDWITRIEGLVEDEKRAKNAVLVFFKNSEMLKKYPHWDLLNCIEERTDPARRNAYIRTAMGSGKVTLLTRSYGRGVDFMMPTGYQVVVVQTFLSSLVSEETQIKGRTARQGQPGQYRLVLCKEHLESKMAFSPGEVDRLRSASGEEIRKSLRSKQSQKTKVKAASMNTRKRKAAELERKTEAWELLLFKPEAPVSAKIQRLADWNVKRAQVHYTLLLDNSSSMRSCWSQLVAAFDSFCTALRNDTLSQALATVSVVLFNSAATIVRPHHAAVTEVQGIGHHSCGGRTSFCEAFTACHSLLSHPQAPAKELILFMTDGGAAFPQMPLEALVADHKARIKRVTCVAFGARADLGGLKLISKHFEDAGVPSMVKASADAASLVEVFTDAADSLAIHGV